MKPYQFTLVLTGLGEITSDVANALYAATEGDIELSLREGETFLEFERTSATLSGAIDSAIQQVMAAKVGVRVVRVESDAGSEKCECF